MKKLILFVFCAVLCVALTSCEKENDGKYNPKKKIQKVYKDFYGEKVLDQVWNWDGKLLSRIDCYFNGEVAHTIHYTYDSKNHITMISAEGEHLDFVYEKGHIKTLHHFFLDELVADFTFFYNNNKLSKIEWERYNVPLKNNSFENKLWPLAGLIPQGYETLEKEIQKMFTQSKGEEKIVLELTWEGKNVSHICLYSEKEPEETKEVSYTYDNNINPLKGWSRTWLEDVLGLWYDDYHTYLSYGNVLTADYSNKKDGVEYNHISMNYVYEYDGKYPVKETASFGSEPYFIHYYEY